MHGVLLAMLMTAAGPAFELQTLDGKKLAGTLVEITSERVDIDAPGGRKSLPIERLLSISAAQKPFASPKTSAIAVELIDGSTIFGRQYAAQDSRASITLSSGLTLTAQTGAVQWVKLRPESCPPADELNRRVSAKTAGDLLVVCDAAGIDYHSGVLRAVTDDVVRFELDGELLPIKRSKVAGFAYRHAKAELPPAVCQITDSFGSQWAARSLSYSGRFQWTTPAGLTVSLPADEVASVDFSSGKVVYLSDLKPESVRWTPYFDAGRPPNVMERFYTPRRDRNFESQPLKTGGVQYAKGLALRGRTEIVYRLTDRFARFRATAGIDDALRPGGRARLIVSGDDRRLLDASVAGGDPPRSIDLDLTGVGRLTVVVDFGDPPGAGDGLLLCEARLCK